MFFPMGGTCGTRLFWNARPLRYATSGICPLRSKVLRRFCGPYTWHDVSWAAPQPAGSVFPPGGLGMMVGPERGPFMEGEMGPTSMNPHWGNMPLPGPPMHGPQNSIRPVRTDPRLEQEWSRASSHEDQYGSVMALEMRIVKVKRLGGQGTGKGTRRAEQPFWTLRYNWFTRLVPPVFMLLIWSLCYVTYYLFIPVNSTMTEWVTRI